jgi:hypothetical protein
VQRNALTSLSLLWNSYPRSRLLSPLYLEAQLLVGAPRPLRETERPTVDLLSFVPPPVLSAFVTVSRRLPTATRSVLRTYLALKLRWAFLFWILRFACAASSSDIDIGFLLGMAEGHLAK